ncbi:hypothetical protein [Bacteroides hominis]|uniref:hypothetical protein n=1 Tax=Bacteroides hominis TaxID=2763023 RepID=UPI0029495B1B|nr:hypothetical protein [Bacteroides hominis (ex Liu et al. 2022)]MDV6195480.1 hypothetical protein [Bacteroides hominis (ex Liu et al. 2022)]
MDTKTGKEKIYEIKKIAQKAFFSFRQSIRPKETILKRLDYQSDILLTETHTGSSIAYR